MEDDDRDDAGALIPDLVKQFMNDPEPFIDSESSRAPLRGQVWCCCDDPRHTIHLPQECGEETFNDGYCRECYAFLHGSTSADS